AVPRHADPCTGHHGSHVALRLLEAAGAPRLLHSFPTRRSSDLGVLRGRVRAQQAAIADAAGSAADLVQGLRILQGLGAQSATSRSEEHTSELQSRFDLVCRLLLEKKKRKCRHRTKQLSITHPAP